MKTPDPLCTPLKITDFSNSDSKTPFTWCYFAFNNCAEKTAGKCESPLFMGRKKSCPTLLLISNGVARKL